MTTFTNKAQEQVKEFHATSGHPVGEKPQVMELGRSLGRSSWGTGEELIEFIHASSSNELEFRNAFAELLVGLKKAYQKQKDKPFPKNEEERVVAQADAIVDRLYFTYGDAVEIGVDIQPIFDIVHEANMSKFFTDKDGNKYAQYNDEGKVIKSPDFWSPEDKIAEEVKRQLEEVKEEEKPKSTRKKKSKVEEAVEEYAEYLNAEPNVGNESKFVLGDTATVTYVGEDGEERVETVKTKDITIQTIKDIEDTDGFNKE